MATLGERIAQFRKEKGLKQDELAEMLGITPQAVSKWENDQTCPDITLLPKLAEILEVTVDELLSGKTEAVVRVVSPEERKDIKDMMFRIVIDSGEGDKVRINLPMGLIQAAIDVGMELPQLSGNDALKSIDFKQILELARQGVMGNLMEIESADGDFVRIFVE